MAEAGKQSASTNEANESFDRILLRAEPLARLVTSRDLPERANSWFVIRGFFERTDIDCR